MVAPRGIAEDRGFDSLAQDWADPMYFDREANVTESGAEIRVAFCNPPFADIDPWAEKLAGCRMLPRWTLMLVPASMGSGWWERHVLGKTMAWGIQRMAFAGESSMYPKDLALIGAGFGVVGHGFWRWR